MNEWSEQWNHIDIPKDSWDSGNRKYYHQGGIFGMGGGDHTHGPGGTIQWNQRPGWYERQRLGYQEPYSVLDEFQPIENQKWNFYGMNQPDYYTQQGTVNPKYQATGAANLSMSPIDFVVGGALTQVPKLFSRLGAADIVFNPFIPLRRGYNKLDLGSYKNNPLASQADRNKLITAVNEANIYSQNIATNPFFKSRFKQTFSNPSDRYSLFNWFNPTLKKFTRTGGTKVGHFGDPISSAEQWAVRVPNIFRGNFQYSDFLKHNIETAQGQTRSMFGNIGKMIKGKESNPYFFGQNIYKYAGPSEFMNQADYFFPKIGGRYVARDPTLYGFHRQGITNQGILNEFSRVSPFLSKTQGKLTKIHEDMHWFNTKLGLKGKNYIRNRVSGAKSNIKNIDDKTYMLRPREVSSRISELRYLFSDASLSKVSKEFIEKHGPLYNPTTGNYLTITDDIIDDLWKHRKHNLIDNRFIGQGSEQGIIRSKTALKELLNYLPAVLAGGAVTGSEKILPGQSVPAEYTFGGKYKNPYIK